MSTWFFSCNSNIVTYNTSVFPPPRSQKQYQPVLIPAWSLFTAFLYSFKEWVQIEYRTTQKALNFRWHFQQFSLCNPTSDFFFFNNRKKGPFLNNLYKKNFCNNIPHIRRSSSVSFIACRDNPQVLLQKSVTWRDCLLLCRTPSGFLIWSTWYK